jgi:folate-dependent phosphoribosylglycinamide formyltransferase PurN
LSDEEIALKYMDLELAEMKAAMARTAMVEAEAELASRIVVMELVEVIEAAAQITERTTVSTARSSGTSKKAELELSILKTLRQSPNGFKRLRGYRKLLENGNLQQWRKRLLDVQSRDVIGRRLRLAG